MKWYFRPRDRKALNFVAINVHSDRLCALRMLIVPKAVSIKSVGNAMRVDAGESATIQRKDLLDDQGKTSPAGPNSPRRKKRAPSFCRIGRRMESPFGFPSDCQSPSTAKLVSIE